MQKCDISKDCHFFLQNSGHPNTYFFIIIFWKAFENEREHQCLTSGQLKCKNSPIWRQNMQKDEISKN